MALWLPAQAQNENTAVVKGRVLNSSTGQYLTDAVVNIDGTSLQTKTGSDGSFRISGLAPGSYNVVASFVDLDRGTVAVSVAAGEEKTVEIGLTSGVYVLEQFVVASEREGSAKTIQQQRQSDSIKNVVASDSFGNMVDGNIGELMKNLPGVTIDYDGEDAAKMRIRGMDPSLASVTMNGNEVASINGTDSSGNDQKASRSFSLKDMPVQNIETIEVNTAPTPDQPAGNMGGSVNFVTKSAFSQKGRRIRVDGNISLNSTALDFQKTPGGGRTPDRKVVPGFNLSYSEAFGKVHPLGVAFVASYAQNYRFNNSYTLPSGYTFNANELAANGGTATASMGGTIPSVLWTERGQSNDRRFISLNLDFKFSDSTALYLYSSYSNDMGLGTYTHSVRVTGGTQPDSSSFNTFVSTAGTTIAPSSSVSNNNTKTWSINPGAKHNFGAFSLSYDGFVSRAEYDPDPSKNYAANYSLTGLGIKIDDISGNATGKVTQLSGADYTNLANYSALTLANDYYYGSDTRYGGKMDGKYSMSLFGLPLVVQAGARFNEQDRDTKRYYRQYQLTGDKNSATFGTAAEPSIKQFADGYFYNKWDFDVPVANWVNPYKVYDYLVANPNKFYMNMLDLTSSTTMVQSAYVRQKMADRYTEERVYAGYIMGTLKPTRSLSVIGGVRYEYTDLLARGWGIDATPSVFAVGHIYDRYTTTSAYYGISDEEALNLLLFKRRATKTYDKLFPNLQAKWEPIKDLVFRGAYSTNMGRPDLGQIMPTDTIYENYNLVKRTNPKLKPQSGENFDLKVEYYLPKSGVASLGVFHQIIKDYIIDITYIEYRTSSDDSTVEPWTIESKDNVGKGTNDGFELNYRQRLGFISSWLDKFEFYTAYSYANPKAEYWRRTATLANAGSSDVLTEAQVDAYMNGPRELTYIDIPGIVRRSANARINYNGAKFTASVAAIWRDAYARSVNTTTLARTMQEAAVNVDLSLSYKLSPRWRTYFDWRNLTKQPDERSIFGRTGGYYQSGMAINLGIRADL